MNWEIYIDSFMQLSFSLFKEIINDMSKCSFLILNYLVTSVQFWFAHACSTFMFHRVDVFVVLCHYITLLAQVIAVDMNFPCSRKYIFMWGDAVPVSRTVQAPKLELLMNCSCGKTISLLRDAITKILMQYLFYLWICSKRLFKRKIFDIFLPYSFSKDWH